MTLAEKIVYSHLDNAEESLGGRNGDVRGSAFLKLEPDRVAMQDASAQMALLQFMTCGLETTAVPSSIHCDHLIRAHDGAEADLKRSVTSNKEVFDFLESAAKRYGIAFWAPGSGIIHQIVLENYSAPGLLMLGTDSHTPNAGGLGAIAIGVGGADAVDAMTNTPWELKAPNVIGVQLTGQLSKWAGPKDLILYLNGKLTVRGGTGSIIEYFGPGVDTLSCTGMATICNMGAEVGATTSVFPYTTHSKSFLNATNRGPVANAADEAAGHGFLAADKDAQYDQVIEVNLSELEPHINGPFTPDLATPLSKFKDFVQQNGWKDQVSAGLIGSCTNSSYEDMSRVASLTKQAKSAGLKPSVPFFVTPGSEQINATIDRDGYTSAMEDIGARVLANACGPCIGQWDRSDIKGEENAILTSFNRNFSGRNDGNAKTMNFLASPEIVTAMTIAGRLSFNPVTDTLPTSTGEPFRFSPPTGEELPSKGFDAGNTDYLPSPYPTPDASTEILVSPTSSRLQILEPFVPLLGPEDQELKDLRVLVRVRGKCTTDAISAAGSWLKYKGHLENIAENTLIGARNDETGKINEARDYENGEVATIPAIAKRWKSRGQKWVVIADHNYGEGSAREHASMQPRFLGCGIIIARSFARIHATNLRKQGILPLTFENENDYLKIANGDIVETVGLRGLVDGVLRGEKDSGKLTVRVTKPDGQQVEISTQHGMSADQLAWFKAGSALNLIKEKAAHAHATA